MSQPTDNGISTGVGHPGWLVIDPGGYPDTWYSQTIAQDEAAAWRRRESTTALRTKMVQAGWTVRAGSWPELFARPRFQVAYVDRITSGNEPAQASA